MAFDSQRQAQNGRIGGYTTASRHDMREHTAPARAAFLSRFEKIVDPNRLLSAPERARRAEAARRAYFSSLAQRSAAARRRKAGQ